MARLRRLPGISMNRRTRRVVMAWYDDADGTLRARGVLARERGGVWQLEGVVPGSCDGASSAWAPGAPPPVLAEAITAARLGISVDGLAEVARFTGREHACALDGADCVSATLLRGAVETGGHREAVSRLRLAGPAPQVEAACAGLGQALDLLVPRGGIPLVVLSTQSTPIRTSTAPAQASIGAFLAAVLPSLTWPVLLGMAALGVEDSAARVHETRVAVRRLRSVLGVVKRPAACAATEALRPMLRELACRLGAARDWDVFLEGSGARLAERLGDEADAARLLAATRRQRAAAYRALHKAFAGPERGMLERQLAYVSALRPWEDAAGDQAALLARDAVAFASGVLHKRRLRVRRAGRDFKHLAPEALHALRKEGKRLRYAAEAFAALFPGAATRRHLKRLRVLQSALGEMQDAEVARELLTQLGGAGRGYAGGLALGIAEGRGDGLRAEAHAAWRRFSKAEAFWS